MNRAPYGGQQRQANNFNIGGGGVVPHNNPPSHLSIGTNTNDQSLAAKASRIFIGNLNPLHADRQKIYEIFREYGHITGLSLQRGYGFIQYTSELEARAAVESEHGRRLGTLNPQHLEKKFGGYYGFSIVQPRSGERFVCEHSRDIRVASEPDENRPVGFKRACGEYANFEFYDPGLLPAQPSAAKRRRFQESALDDERSGDEPPAWVCAVCKHVEVSPWELMKHAAAIHQLLIYDVKSNKAKTGNGTI